MQRPNVDTILMRTAQLWAERSTCTRNRVGAVLSRDGRILATGYNGAPAGHPHCSHKCDCRMTGSPFNRVTHNTTCASIAPCTIAVHAELNAIAFAARYGYSTNHSMLHVTLSPCVPCAQLIINAGVSVLFYEKAYRDLAGIDLLKQCNVTVAQMRTIA